MTTYKELFGKAVNYLSSDPTADAEGQIWYNSTSGTFKSVVVGEAWSSQTNNPLNTNDQGFGFGGTTSAFITGGFYTPGANTNANEFNGSGWASISSFNSAGTWRCGTGIQTAGLIVGGYIYPGPPVPNLNATEEYNGSTWTSSGNYPQTGYAIMTSGTQTSALAATGSFPGGVGNAVNEYDGASWTAGGSYPTTLYQIASEGTQTATLATGGNNGPTYYNTSNEYNGSTWSAEANYPVNIISAGSFGTSTDAVVFGGSQPGYTSATNTYNGTSWTTSSATLAKAGTGHSSSKNSPSSNGIVTIDSSPYTGATEEYSSGLIGTKTLTTS